MSVLPEDLSDLSCRSLFLHMLTNGKKVLAAPVELPTIFSPPASPTKEKKKHKIVMPSNLIGHDGHVTVNSVSSHV